MEGWRQRRIGSEEDHSTTKSNYKIDLTLTGLLMEGLGSVIVSNSPKIVRWRYTLPIPSRREPMAILPGKRLGPYEILSAIGVDGMGEVYKARDTRLNRIAAIKVL